MTKIEIAQNINGIKDLGRIISTNTALKFTKGKIYDNQGNVESWTDRDNSNVAFEPMTNGIMYVLHCNQVPCHVVDYENEDECLAIGALGCEEEAECLVLPTTKMRITSVSNKRDYKEMGYYLVELELVNE